MHLFVCLFICTFALSLVFLTNRLTQAFKVRIDCSVKFCGAVSIFLISYILPFKSYEFFKERTERFSVRIEK